MEEITREVFKSELEALHYVGARLNVESIDCYDISLSLCDCIIEEDGLSHDAIIIHKPYTQMEVRINYDIIDAIYKEENTYTLEFNNGMPDIEITVTEE